MSDAERAARELINQLVQLRKHRGLTQTEVAARIHISRPSICMLENHYRGLPNIETLIRYAQGVGAEINITVKGTR